MKILHIEARRKIKDYDVSDFKNLPDKLHILYSIQFKSLAEEIVKNLGKRVVGVQQVLGCSKVKPKASLLLIGSGRFHATQIAYDTKKPVYIYDGSISQITDKEIQEYEKKGKIKISKFLLANNIGIIISTKHGQNKKPDFSALEKKYSDKKFYLFVTDNINLQELENFQIDFWLNTACPGIENDAPNIINLQNLDQTF